MFQLVISFAHLLYSIRDKSEVKMTSNMTSIPFCSGAENAGCYLLGDDVFHTRSTKFASILQRKVAGEYDSFLLSCLCVMFTATIADIVHTIVLRNPEKSSTSLFTVQVAYLFDELIHFRNLISCFGRTKAQREVSMLPAFRLSRRSSFCIFVVAIAIFGVEVAIIYAAQGRSLVTEKQYNLRGVHPVRSPRLEKWTTEQSRTKVGPILVVPIIMDGDDLRKFFLFSKAGWTGFHDLTNAQTSYNLHLLSCFHQAGNNHVVTYTQGTRQNWLHVHSRVQLFVDNKKFSVLFENIDGPDGQFAREIQVRSVQEAVNNSCIAAGMVRSRCEQNVASIASTPMSDVRHEFQIWPMLNDEDSPTGAHMANVTCQRTSFEAVVFSPATALFELLSYLMGSSAVFEEYGSSASYVNLDTNKTSTSVRGLAIEEAHHVGLVPWATLLFICTALALILRRLLKPMSPQQVAFALCLEEADTTYGKH